MFAGLGSVGAEPRNPYCGRVEAYITSLPIVPLPFCPDWLLSSVQLSVNLEQFLSPVAECGQAIFNPPSLAQTVSEASAQEEDEAEALESVSGAALAMALV